MHAQVIDGVKEVRSLPQRLCAEVRSDLVVSPVDGFFDHLVGVEKERNAVIAFATFIMLMLTNIVIE